jgi:hypothetical protein
VPEKSEKPAVKELLGDEQARGIELALTPVVFAGLGWLLDGWLGTGVAFTAGLAAFALFGTVVKIWYGYDAQMREHEASGPWARPTEDAGSPSADVDLWADRKADR